MLFTLIFQPGSRLPILSIVLLGVALFAVPVSAQDDAFLYYRRTHDGALPPAGWDTSDHSTETTNTAGAVLPPAKGGNIKLFNLLDGGVDPANLGKGDWIWQLPSCQTALGVADVQGVIDYEKNKGMQWITVKCGDGGSTWAQFNADLVTRAHTAGLKIFGWAYAYGNNVPGEINVALNALALGADGFIIDAETEYETNVTRHVNAAAYARAIKTNYPTRFLAHAPFPYISLHSGFPYVAFGTNCDAVMPQAYWDELSSRTGGSPTDMVLDLDTEWKNWQNSLTGFNTNAIKPIVPIGQGYNATPGSEITAFVNALATDASPASVGGYRGVSFWSCQHHTTDQWNAIGAASIGTNGIAPAISSAPASRWADRGGNLAFRVTATGTTPLKYQWRLNNLAIPNATNGTLTLTSLQTSNAGNYTVIITNGFGGITSSVAVLTVNPLFTPVFSDDFEVDSSSSWLRSSSSPDTRATFAWNYAPLGINPAPHSAGTTKGLRLEANLTAGATAALNVSPIGQAFAGNYRLHFDAWMNVNGPLPGGGSGSTEHLTAGVGTSGNNPHWNDPLSGADGIWFAVDGEGGVGDTSATLGDFLAYSGVSQQSVGSGVYAAGTGTTARGSGDPYYANVFPGGQTPPAAQQSGFSQQTGALNVGTMGFAWRDVVVNKSGSTVEWFIDGLKLASVSGASITSSNIFVGYWDAFPSLSDNTNLSFALVDNVRVEIPAVAPAISFQPLATSIKVTSNATFNITASGTPSPTYQWQFNGEAIAGANASSFTRTNVQYSEAGNYSVVVSNIAGALLSSNALLTILPAAAAEFIGMTPQPDSSLIATIAGDAGATYYIQTSTNLVDWTALTNVSMTAAQMQFNIGATTNEAQRFFRARSAP